MTETKKITLSAGAREMIDKWLTQYPPEQKRSAVLEALRYVQDENGGWLTEPLMNAVAEYLDMPKIAVYEVATFYSMFNLEPVGKYVINVCNNISCMLSGAHEIIEHLQKRLGIALNETTADGKFTLREVECLAACVRAPMLQIGKKYYEHLTSEKVDAILRELTHGE